MANPRHEMILQLIQKHDISTQEMLRDLLEENGYSVTQATISRDIRQLKLRKRRTASGLSCYAKTPAAAAAPSNLLADVVVKIDYAVNIVAVACHAGSAPAACAVLDRMQLPEIVGTIAGDDTIFILTRSEASAKQLISLLESHIWG